MEPGYSARELARHVSGRVEGDPERRVTGVAPVEQAGEGDLTFVVSEKYVAALEGRKPGAVLVPEGLGVPPAGATLIYVANPRLALSRLVGFFREVEETGGDRGIAPTARLGRGVRLGEGVSIGPFAVLGEGATVGDGSRIGAHTVLGAGASVGRGCVIGDSCSILGSVRMGDRVRVLSGARLGTDGFGYVDDAEVDVSTRIPQVGRCLIGDDVEVGANVTIDRGALGDTVIGARTKVDNLVHIGHNVRIGEDCMIVAQVGIAGSSEIGDDVRVAGQAGIAGHLRIGDGVRVAARAGVIGDVPEGATVSGYPARPHRQAMRATASLYRLPDLVRRLRRIERELERGREGRAGKEGDGE